MIKRSPVLAIVLLTLVACAAPPPPDYAALYTPALNVFMGGYNDGNIEGLDVGLAPNVQRHSPGGYNAEGLPAFKKFVTDLRASYPDMKVVLDKSYFMKDMSIHLWTFTGTNTGPGAVAPTGKAVKLSGMTRLMYQDGKIVDELVYFDALDMQLQLGYTLAPPASAPAPRKKQGAS
jgi:predicted ester cyclase